MKRLFLVFAVLVAAAVPSVYAWWWAGHQSVVEGAAAVLPEDMPAFFREGGETLALHTREPDMWTEFKKLSLRKTTRAEHYLDLELLKGRALPRTRPEYHTLCAEVGTDPFIAGTLPYMIDEWHQRLTIALAEYRTWPKDKRIQAKVLYIAAILGHYTADACQPLHTTIHFDGRADQKGKSPHTGIHHRFDALIQNLGLQPSSIKDLEPAADIFQTAVAAIQASHALVDQVYELETKLPPAEKGKPEKIDAEIQALAQERLDAAVRLTAVIWYSAWKQSAELKIPSWYH